MAAKKETLKESIVIDFKARNEAFDAMSKRERAVAVAKDVLQQIELKKYVAENGRYFELFSEDYSVNDTDALQPLLEQPRVTCNVCAIGATFASCVRLNNKATVQNQHMQGHEMVNVGLVAFNEKEMKAMEAVFEGCSIGYAFPDGESPKLYAYRARILKKHKLDDDDDDASEIDEIVLRTIMQNVIDNGGRFIVKGVPMSSTKPNKD